MVAGILWVEIETTSHWTRLFRERHLLPVHVSVEGCEVCRNRQIHVMIEGFWGSPSFRFFLTLRLRTAMRNRYHWNRWIFLLNSVSHNWECTDWKRTSTFLFPANVSFTCPIFPALHHRAREMPSNHWRRIPEWKKATVISSNFIIVISSNFIKHHQSSNYHN